MEKTDFEVKLFPLKDISRELNEWEMVDLENVAKFLDIKSNPQDWGVSYGDSRTMLVVTKNNNSPLLNFV